MSVLDVVQGLCFALKLVKQTIKDKGENDILTKELLITVESVNSIVDGLREAGLLTKNQLLHAQNMYETTGEVQKEVLYYLTECSSFYRALNEASFKTKFDSLRNKMDSRLAQLTASLAAGNSAKLTKVLDHAEGQATESR